MFTSKNIIILALMGVLFVVQQINAQNLPVPPFLKNAPENVKEEFKKLLEANYGKTDKEIDAAVDKWAEKQDASIKVTINY